MPLTRIKTKGLGTSVTFENITDTGTEGTKVAAGTSAQRGSTTGQWRYNSETGFFEGRNTDGTFSTLQPDPVVSSVDDGEVDSAGGGNQTIVVTGQNFTTGGTIAFVGSSAEFNASTTTFNSATQVTAVAPKASFLNAQEPYKVRFTSAGGKIGISAVGLISVDNAPAWTTSAGTIATIQDSATGTHATLAATDAEGDTVTYSETGGTNITGAGLSLNSANGQITGDPTNVGSSTTVSFTGRATAGSKTTDRSFNIIINPTLDGSSQALAAQYGSEIIALGGFSAGLYWLTGKSSLGLTAQQVYVDTDGYMLVYRHAGTGGSYNSTYEIQGDSLGEAAVGTLTSPTMGLTTSGVSTTAGSRGMARLSAQFCNALGGDSASGQVTRITVNNTTHYITDAKIWWTAASGDGYGEEQISAGNSYANRRSTSYTPGPGRPIGTYRDDGSNSFGATGLISYYHGSSYSGGYEAGGGGWHQATTIWVRQY